MKSNIVKLITNALNDLCDQGILNRDHLKKPIVEETKDKKNGDFASNVAMANSKLAQLKPVELAKLITEAIPKTDFISKISIASPGFINFEISQNSFTDVIFKIIEKKENYGTSNYGKNKKVHIEFVSANPTGPLHVGHGRGAAYGSVIANLLSAIGFDVHTEYYVNDAGRQMDILAVSVWLRYLELIEPKFSNHFPNNGYRGDYIQDIAANLLRENKENYFFSLGEVFQNNLNLKSQEIDEEKIIDGLIERAKSLLGKASYDAIYEIGLETILNDIRQDLSFFNVEFDDWFFESSLVKLGLIDKTIKNLQEKKLTYKKDNAVWFKAKKFDDEKDRVLIRENGQYTYFASDIAYHLNKLEKGFLH